VDILLDHPERAMAKDRGKGGDIDASLGHSSGERMPPVVEHEVEWRAGLTAGTGSVVGAIQTHNVSPRLYR
jgi:hypothetical protein